MSETKEREYELEYVCCAPNQIMDVVIPSVTSDPLCSSAGEIEKKNLVKMRGDRPGLGMSPSALRIFVPITPA